MSPWGRQPRIVRCPQSFLFLSRFGAWQEFLDAGGEVSGFRQERWKRVQHIKSGDYLLCYMTGISKWVGVLEVTSPAFKDDTPIWKDDPFPCRVRVRVIASLTPETGLPVTQLKEKLTISVISRA